MVMTPLVLQAKDSLANIAAICDDQLGLTPGFSLLVVRHLLANRVWQVNTEGTDSENFRAFITAKRPK